MTKLTYVQNYFEGNTLKEYTFNLYSVIGGCGANGQDFANELAFIASLEEVETIHIRICSPGGSVLDGLAIISAILNCKKTVITYADGLVASIASLIFLAGDITLMWECGMLMFHNASGGSPDVLEKFNTVLNTLYQKRLNKTAEQVKAWMDAETYFLPQEAVAEGLVDKIFETPEKVAYAEKAKEDGVQSPESVNALFELYVQNLSIFEGNESLTLKNKQDAMLQDKLVELYNLAGDVTGDQVLEKVQETLTQLQNLAVLQDAKATLEAQVTNYVSELESIKNQLVEKDSALSEKETEITTLTTQVDQKETQVIELTNKLSDYQGEEVKRQNERVEALVNGALAAQKISASEKDEWVATANDNYERAEKMLNGMRSLRNKISDVLNKKEDPNASELNPFAAKKAEVKNRLKK